MNAGLDQVLRLKRLHKAWIVGQILYGSLPVFGVVNKFQPILTDGYGHDLIPRLLPVPLSVHYHLLLALAILALVVSELLRRRFYSRHKQDLEL